MALLCRGEGRKVLRADIPGEERLDLDTGPRLDSEVGVILAVGIGREEATQLGNKGGCMDRRIPD
jgi:hypothetical protein